MTRLLRRVMVRGAMVATGGAVVAGGGVGALYYLDEGFRRSMVFWGEAFPIYLHYEAIHQATKGKSDQEINDAFDVLHEKYSPVVKDLTLQLRGFYLKMAQVSSTVSNDTVPPQYLKWCQEMQDEVPTPFKKGQARKLVEESLGRPIEEIFASFDDLPCGSASIGQVHHAILKDGTEVAVKIQYPGIERKFRSDLGNIIRFCQLAMPQHVKPLREIEKQFMTEFDYVDEAKNLAEIGTNIQSVWKDKIYVPKPIPELCTKTVLTMDYVHGVPLLKELRNRTAAFAKSQNRSVKEVEDEFLERMEEAKKMGQLASLDEESRRVYWGGIYMRGKDYMINSFKLAYNWTLGFVTGSYAITWTESPLNIAEIIKTLLRVHGYEIFVDGAFNGDPHPGNVLMMKDGRLGLIDYGQVKRLPISDRILYAKLIKALAHDDRDEIIRLWTKEMNQKSKYNNPDIGYRLACFWHDRNTQDIIGDHNLHTFMEKMEQKDPTVRLNEQFVMAARVSVLMRGFGNMCGMELRVAPIWEEYADYVLQGSLET
ncbi:hypothetical protein AAMO2058_000802800 [Amorphochlora amoebiformis]